MSAVWVEYPELTNELVSLWNGGKSAREIAPILGKGLTRSAVTTKIGRLRKSGVSVRSTEIFQAKTVVRGEKFKDPEPVEKPKPIAPVLLPDGSPVTPLNATSRHCRYNYGEPFDADFRFCGRQVAKGSFCDAHWKICHQPKHAATQDLEAP